MVPPASHRISRVPRYSGSVLLFSPSLTGLSPSLAALSIALQLSYFQILTSSTPDDRSLPVWPLTVSLATTKVIEFSFFSSGYLDVSVSRVPLHTLWIGVGIHAVCSCGFPHSEISGSMDICPSPKLIAAYHVFLRPLVPRHPPCALIA